jgi:hypothetical protein
MGGHYANGATGLDFLDKLIQTNRNTQASDRESVRYAESGKAAIVLFPWYQVDDESKRKIMRHVASTAECKKSSSPRLMINEMIQESAQMEHLQETRGRITM